MHVLLNFVSGLGPRKAKKILLRMKSLGKKLEIRGDLLRDNYIGKYCYLSAISFIKIRNPLEARSKDTHEDILDQTRIHSECYLLAKKVAIDALEINQDDKFQQH